MMKKALQRMHSPFKQGQSIIPHVASPIKLSSNECPYPPSPKAIQAYQDAVGRINRYPDNTQKSLKNAIHSIYDIPQQNLIITNGSEEAICLLMRAVLEEGDHVVVSENNFPLTNTHILSCGAQVIKAPEQDGKVHIDTMLSLVHAKTKVVVVCNPNNPTGTVIPFADIVRLERLLPPQVVLLLDSAYAEYAENAHLNDYDCGFKLFSPSGRTVVTRTCSKAYGLAGLRVGWSLFPDALVDAISRIRTPFNVNVAAISAATEAILDHAYMLQMVRRNNTIREAFCQDIAKLGITHYPSYTNFVMVDFTHTGKSADDVHTYLLGRGIICRPQPQNPMQYRISIGTESEMQILTDTLRAYMAD